MMIEMRARPQVTIPAETVKSLGIKGAIKVKIFSVPLENIIRPMDKPKA